MLWLSCLLWSLEWVRVVDGLLLWLDCLGYGWLRYDCLGYRLLHRNSDWNTLDWLIVDYSTAISVVNLDLTARAR